MFKYVWIVILGVFWLVWTVNTLKEFICDYKYYGELGMVFSENPEVSTYVICHVVAIFFGSLIYFCATMIRG